MENLPLSNVLLQNVGTKAKYGFLGYEIIGNYYFFKQNYEIISIPLFPQYFFISFITNKNSTLKRIFNKK